MSFPAGEATSNLPNCKIMTSILRFASALIVAFTSWGSYRVRVKSAIYAIK